MGFSLSPCRPLLQTDSATDRRPVPSCILGQNVPFLRSCDSHHLSTVNNGNLLNTNSIIATVVRLLCELQFSELNFSGKNDILVNCSDFKNRNVVLAISEFSHKMYRSVEIT